MVRAYCHLFLLHLAKVQNLTRCLVVNIVSCGHKPWNYFCFFFCRLFETNEEIRTMFTKIVRTTHYNVSELRDNKELENHVRQVMYTLDEAISTLEDVDAVVELLHSVGHGHKRLQDAGFNPKIFWVSVQECQLLSFGKDFLNRRIHFKCDFLLIIWQLLSHFALLRSLI